MDLQYDVKRPLLLLILECGNVSMYKVQFLLPYIS